MAKLSAWPDCMYQLMPPILSHFVHDKHMVTGVTELSVVLAADTNELHRNVMLAAFGDLQAVWQNPALSQVLMKLPLPAIQLLLSSDKLQVPSEDIVLYTVEQYGKNQPSTQDSMAALSSLVRAPYLSEFALQFVALSGSCSVGSKKQLNQLITLRRVIGSQPPTSELQVLSGAPSSWLQGPRSLVDQEPVSVIWKLPIEQLADACKRAAALNNTQVLRSPDSPPLGGLSWRLSMHCCNQDDGITVGLYAGCSKQVNEMFHKFRCHVNYNNTQREVQSGCLVLGSFCGSSDFFKVGAMAGGWDATAWASKGLPTSGDLVLELKMLKVW